MKTFTDRRTEAQKQAAAAKLQAIIAFSQSIKGMSEENMLAAIGEIPVLRFDGEVLSLRNQMIARHQNPACMQLAGFKQWQSVGRQVLQGAKAIIICAATVHKAKTEGEADGIGFRSVSVFDISQTLPFAEAEALKAQRKELAYA